MSLCFLSSLVLQEHHELFDVIAQHLYLQGDIRAGLQVSRKARAVRRNHVTFLEIQIFVVRQLASGCLFREKNNSDSRSTFGRACFCQRTRLTLDPHWWPTPALHFIRLWRWLHKRSANQCTLNYVEQSTTSLLPPRTRKNKNVSPRYHKHAETEKYNLYT